MNILLIALVAIPLGITMIAYVLMTAWKNAPVERPEMEIGSHTIYTFPNPEDVRQPIEAEIILDPIIESTPDYRGSTARYNGQQSSMLALL